MLIDFNFDSVRSQIIYVWLLLTLALFKIINPFPWLSSKDYVSDPSPLI